MILSGKPNDITCTSRGYIYVLVLYGLLSLWMPIQKINCIYMYMYMYSVHHRTATVPAKKD